MSPLPADAAAIPLGLAPEPDPPQTPRLLLRVANRHGLIAGATGTGKTATLQLLAEGFSARGVPVFLADVKGDLAGISRAGSAMSRVAERLARLRMAPDFAASPAIFWDLRAEQGHPVRATVSGMGPLLLARLLELNDVQEGVLNVAFKVADDEGLLLLDLKDLRAMLANVAERADALAAQYGNVTKATVGTIQRQLLVLEQQGAERFFGEPALALADLLRVDAEGRGYVSILAADRLMESPRTYAAFLLWMLSELFESLPEVGDLEKPKLVFVFDEAHLLFADAPRALVEKAAQLVRLIRSKGVGVYFATQNPLDIPEPVLAQLGNRVQHAMRAFTPRDQKTVRAIAETMRASPSFDAAEALPLLGVGEALVSLLDEAGAPAPVARTLVAPPRSRLGPVSATERSETVAKSPVEGKYDAVLDRESAYEKLAARGAPSPAAAPASRAAPAASAAPEKPPAKASGGAAGLAESVLKAANSAEGRRLGRQILRGVLGSMRR